VPRQPCQVAQGRARGEASPPDTRLLCSRTPPSKLVGHEPRRDGERLPEEEPMCPTISPLGRCPAVRTADRARLPARGKDSKRVRFMVPAFGLLACWGVVVICPSALDREHHRETRSACQKNRGRRTPRIRLLRRSRWATRLPPTTVRTGDPDAVFRPGGWEFDLIGGGVGGASMVKVAITMAAPNPQARPLGAMTAAAGGPLIALP